jgi:hypothetical protein
MPGKRTMITTAVAALLGMNSVESAKISINPNTRMF